MTASNHTYSLLVGVSRHPSNGTGMPQSMSRVIARGRMSARMFCGTGSRSAARCATASRPSSHSASASASCRQIEEEVLGLDELRRLAVDLARRGFVRSAESS